jgi:copper chaperone CopZ
VYLVYEEDIMEDRRFQAPNISCPHCVMTIRRELGELEGVVSVEGDPDTKTVEVKWEAPATWDSIVELLTEINYPPASASI